MALMRTGRKSIIDCIAVFVLSFSSFSGKVLILIIFTIKQLPLLRKLYWANHILFKYCLKTGFWKVFFTTVKCLPSNINKAYNNKGYTAIVEPVFLLSKLTHLRSCDHKSVLYILCMALKPL